MTPTDRTYRTSEFAALAGVTPRALRHYDQLGLLRPRRTDAGYRVYAHSDLEVLEEIVALRFIGVPLRRIADVRRQSKTSFIDALRVQRAALESTRTRLGRAIDVIAAAEGSLARGEHVDASLFRRIIQEMQMETNHEETIARYTTMLKAKVSHLAALSADERAALREQWTQLLGDIKDALDEEPDSPKAQTLLDRWLTLQRAATGATSVEQAAKVESQVTPELREGIWDRRADWLPADVAHEAPADSREAEAQVRERIQGLADERVLDFIRRATAVRRE